MGNQPPGASSVAQGHTSGKRGNGTMNKPKRAGTLKPRSSPNLVLLAKEGFSVNLSGLSSTVSACGWNVGTGCPFLMSVTFLHTVLPVLLF